MDYQYIAYAADKKLVKGRLSASSEIAAANMLSYSGYQVIKLEPIKPILELGNLTKLFSRVQPREIVTFSRQLAILLESGTDIVTSLELLQDQVPNKNLKRIISNVVSDIRGGESLSAALRRHPEAFSVMYHRAISAGEQSGNLEVVLRQMADYMERAIVAMKRIKGALRYPVIVAVVAIIVITIMVTFVLPTFTNLYKALGAEMPPLTKMLLGVADWSGQYGLFLIMALVAALVLGFAYTRSPVGRVWWDGVSLRLPLMGRIFLLNELSRACQTMALLFKVGLPLPEIMTITIQGSDNKIVANALSEVQHEMIRGEGISRPMAKRPIFLPLMVQMVAVGEQTGNLTATLTTVAESFEAEADERTSSAIGLIQPAITLAIGLVVALIAGAMISAMYGMYGQL